MYISQYCPPVECTKLTYLSQELNEICKTSSANLIYLLVLESR